MMHVIAVIFGEIGTGLIAVLVLGMASMAILICVTALVSWLWGKPVKSLQQQVSDEPTSLTDDLVQDF